MRISTRNLFLAGTCAVFLISASDAAAQGFSKGQLKCRQTIAKSASKLASTMAKTLAGCHKSRAKDAALSAIDCNDSGPAGADSKGKVQKAKDKFTAAVGGSKDKCAGIVPSDILYVGPCPAPCTAVGALGDMAAVSTCLQCLVEAEVEGLSIGVQGTPLSPLDKSVAKCNDTIGKAYGKILAAALKDLTKCQSTAEKKSGVTTTTDCLAAYPSAKVQSAVAKGRGKVTDKCGLTPTQFTTDLDTCGGTQIEVRDCVSADSQTAGGALGAKILELALTVTTTSTTTSTTSTTLPPADPACPVRGELTIWAGISQEVCASNVDCTAPRTCDTGLGLCTTRSRIDSGFTGLGHRGDVNGQSPNYGFLNCPGPATPSGCGVCQVTGIDPSIGNCRCANDNRAICDQPFQADAVNCGGDICNCYFGAPLPLNASGVAVCAVNRFSADLSGTADVDLGAGAISAKLRTKVFNGLSNRIPCPYCGGTCSGDPTLFCAQDSHCDLATCDFGFCQGNSTVTCAVNADCNKGTCTGLDPVANDGVRGGVCAGGIDEGLPCDVMAVNSSFPASGGGGHSLDCFPDPLSNTSGQGLRIELTQTTGTSGPIAAQVSCGGIFAGFNCPCRVCGGDPSVVCNTDADCAAVGAGLCDANGGSGSVFNQPNSCQNSSGGFNGLCTDLGGGFGECTIGPDDNYCDGQVRADGRGIITCSSNADCSGTGGGPWGNCTIAERRSCFPDPLSATGQADPTAPVGAAVFCLPPTGSGVVNGAAGLPGLGKVVNQVTSKTFCSDGVTQYTPGSPNCP